jgi:hypothetical protein
MFFGSTFTETWPSSGDDLLGHTFRLTLAPGASASLAYFVYHGLAEAGPGPQACEYYAACVPTPAPGSQVALAETTAAALALHPNFCDLSDVEFSKIVNWPGKLACGQFDLYLPAMLR